MRADRRANLEGVDDETFPPILADVPWHRSGSPIRGAMGDNLELNVECLSKRLKKQALGFRQLADESIDGEFRSRVLDLALDYERQAERLKQHPPGGSETASWSPRLRV
jgi:hypothetical protein